MSEIQLAANNPDKRNYGGAERVLEAAENDKLTDEQFIQAIVAAQKPFPELFDDLNHDARSEAMEDTMGAAVINGAVKGALKRKLKWNGIQPQMNADGRRFFGSVPRFPSASICVYLRLTNCNRTQVSPGIEP